jgi:hypothetical protein
MIELIAERGYPAVRITISRSGARPRPTFYNLSPTRKSCC